jgi:hypothetical protein
MSSKAWVGKLKKIPELSGKEWMMITYLIKYSKGTTGDCDMR